VIRQFGCDELPLLQQQGIDFPTIAPQHSAPRQQFLIDSANASRGACERRPPSTASLTAESKGPPVYIQGSPCMKAARSSIPVPPPAAKIIIGARAASQWQTKRKNSRSISIFSSTRRLRLELPDFHRQHPRRMPATSSGFFANVTPPMRLAGGSKPGS